MPNEYGRKWYWHSRNNIQQLAVGIEENHEDIIQDVQCPAQSRLEPTTIRIHAYSQPARLENNSSMSMLFSRNCI
jgi:hypothetical protein